MGSVQIWFKLGSGWVYGGLGWVWGLRVVGLG